MCIWGCCLKFLICLAFCFFGVFFFWFMLFIASFLEFYSFFIISVCSINLISGNFWGLELKGAFLQEEFIFASSRHLGILPTWGHFIINSQLKVSQTQKYQECGPQNPLITKSVENFFLPHRVKHKEGIFLVDHFTDCNFGCLGFLNL